MMRADQSCLPRSITKATLIGGVLSSAVWTTLNITLSIMNKWLFVHEYPVLLILSGTMSTLVAGLSYITVKKAFETQKIRECWKLLLVLAIFTTAGSVLENVSILYVSISFNQVVKSTSPVWTMILSWMYESKSYSKSLIGATSFIVIGALLMVYHNPGFNLFGFLLAVGSTLLQAIQAIITAKLLQGYLLSSIFVATVAALPGVLMLLPTFYIFEYESLLNSSFATATIAYIILASSVLGFLYNVSHIFLIYYTSAHYSAIIGNFKTVLLVSISIPFFQTKLTAYNAAGMATALAAFLAYNIFNYREGMEADKNAEHKHEPTHDPELPNIKTDEHSIQ